MRRALFSKREEPASVPIPNPAAKYKGPNVSQYGWTTYEVEQINQLVQYVEMAREAAESAAASAKLAQDSIELISNLKDDITVMYGNISTYYSNMLTWYTDFSEKYQDFLLKYREIQEVFVEIRDLKEKVDSTHRLVEKLAADIVESVESSKQSAVEAEASNVGAKGWYDKSYELYLDLSQGNVYRGTWNPNSGAYPTEISTNARWDVVLNPGQLEVTFDDKRWFWGDRLLYSFDTKSFTQVESGTAVQSVNGKTGAVVLTASEVGALPIAGGTVNGNLAVKGVINTQSGGYGFRTVTSSGLVYVQGGKTDSDENDQKLILSGYMGKKLTKLDILTKEEGLATVNGKKIFTEGTKPSADDITPGTFQGPVSYKFKKEIITLSSDSYRITSSGGEAGIGSFWRNDGSNLYLMFTDNGRALTGNYNALRPARFNLATGRATFESGIDSNGINATSGNIVANNGHVYSESRSTAVLRAHNVVTNKMLQIESNAQGSQFLAVRDGSNNWATSMTFNDGGAVVVNGPLHVQNKTSISDGGTDCYVHNRISGKFLQLRDNGHLDYDNKHVLLITDNGTPGYFNQDIPRLSLTNASGESPQYELHVPGKYAANLVLNASNGNLEFWETSGNGQWNKTYGFWNRSNGEFWANGNGSFNDVYIRSDARLKHNLKPIEGALDKIDAIEGFTYDKQVSLSDNTILKREAGIIAQSLRDVLPEAVNESDDTTLTISNSAVNALLLQAIKELKEEVAQLKRDLGR